MKTLLSVDPGTKAVGWALWKGETLARCDVSRGEKWWLTLASLPEVRPDVLYIEDQQIYSTSKINAHSLLAVARVTGAIIYHYKAPSTVLVLPRVWKGQVPKKICSERTLNRLNEAEMQAVNSYKQARYLEHNMVDAIGIGLWALGRK